MDASIEKSAIRYRHIFKNGVRSLRQKFVEPRSAEEDKRRREYILNVLLLGSIIMLVLLDGFVLYYSLREGSNYHGVPFGIFSIIPVFFFLLYTFSRRGFVSLASYLFIAAYFASTSYAAYRWGVDLQIVLLSYALVIVIATILISTKFGFVTTTAVAALIVPMWYAQMHGLIATEPQRPSTSDALVFSIIFFLIMTVAWLSNREIERSLSRARRSEGELREQRDLLEVKVEERTRELKESQFEKIKQLHRFAEFGQLASGLLHDTLNLLNAVSLRTERQTGTSLDSTQRTTKEIENFIVAIRKQMGRQESNEVFSLTEAVKPVTQLLSYKAHKEHVELIFRPDKDPLMYFGDPFKFHQVIMNLLLNAIESYETLPDSDGRERTAIMTIERNGHYAVVRVEDHGSGISANIREKVFEPFFTTKESSKGVGVGLATVKKVVEEEFLGTVVLSNNDGVGSVFTATFPMASP